MININDGLSYFQKFQPVQDEESQAISDKNNVRQPPRDQQLEQMQNTRFQASRQESQDITLTTREGDTVTISSLTQLQAQYLSFDYAKGIKNQSDGQTTNQSASVMANTLEAVAKNSFQIKIEGDLNEEEKADMEKILGKLDEIMNDLVSGDIDSIMKEAMGILDGTQTISGLDATLEFHQQISLEQQTLNRITPQGPPPGENRPPMPPPPGQLKDGLQALSSLVAKITDQMTELISSSNIDTSKWKEPLQQMFSGIMEQLSADQPGNELKSELVKQIETQLAENLEEKN